MNPIISTEKVRLAFSKKQVKEYNKWALPQKKAAKQLSVYYSKLHNKKVKTLLDAGSGTGLLTQYVNKLYPQCSITGLDISENIIQEYKKLKHTNAYTANMESTPFDNHSFDSTLSSFSIHWTDIQKTIKEFIRITKYYIAFNIPVKGSLDAFNFPFYEKEYIINEIKQYCNNVDTHIQKINIPYKKLDLVKYFHYTGVSNLNPQKPINKPMKKIKLENFIQKYSQKELCYIVLYVLVRL